MSDVTAYSADGVPHTFPEGTDVAVIDRVMKDYATKGAAPPPPPAAAPSMSMGEMGSQALQNFPSSALNLVKNIVQPVLHPIQTAENLYHLGAGIVEKFTPGTQADEATANAVGKYFADRYGGLENVKKTIATDPAGFMADASVVLGGGGAALKATGVLNKAANVANQAGHIANPITLGLSAANKTANVAVKGLAHALGALTQKGPRAIEQGFQAGVEGGPASQAFLGDLRGTVPQESLVPYAQAGINKLKETRGADYRAGMAATGSNPQVLNFAPIDAAVSSANDINSFKGVDLAQSTTDIRKKLADQLAEWKKKPAADFHTAEGFDALKKSLKDTLDTTQPGTPDRAIASKIYNAVRDAIVKQDPGYADTMQRYEDASDTIDELQRTLSLKDSATTDTALKKLQSTLRDNVNTSNGYRSSLADELAKSGGAPQLMYRIAGQTLSPAMPGSMGKVLTSSELTASIVEALQGNPKMAAALLAAMPLQSPRLVGEAAHLAGRAKGLAKALMPKGVNAGSSAQKAQLLRALQQNQGQPAMAGENQ